MFFPKSVAVQKVYKCWQLYIFSQHRVCNFKKIKYSKRNPANERTEHLNMHAIFS